MARDNVAVPQSLFVEWIETAERQERVISEENPGILDTEELPVEAGFS